MFGVTKFADWSTEDLDRLGSNRLSKFDSVPQYFVDSKKAVKSSAVVNWAGVYTTPVKDQGLCDCCWAISTATQIESDAIRAGYLTTDQPLSFQQVLSWWVGSLRLEMGFSDKQCISVSLCPPLFYY